ncbi:MAG: hypothetical protein Q8O40_17920 [Chloroflexota bacterium]|nr:hypothetical protein [Chloroflexota bacterium]
MMLEVIVRTGTADYPEEPIEGSSHYEDSEDVEDELDARKTLRRYKKRGVGTFMSYSEYLQQRVSD